MTKILTEKQLGCLTTPRLLAYRNSLLRCNESKDEDGHCLHKASKDWQNIYAKVIAILNAREHVKR